MSAPPGSIELAMMRRRVRESLPAAMANVGVDLFVVVTREPARDPCAEEVGLGAVPARVAAILHRAETVGIRAVALVVEPWAASIQAAGLYDEVLTYGPEGLRPMLARVLANAAPGRIAVNTCRDLAFGDGLTSGMRDLLESAAGKALASRFVSSQDLLVEWLGRKLPEEQALIEQAVVATQDLLGDVLAPGVVVPGVTTVGHVQEALERGAAARQMPLGFATVRVGALPLRQWDAVVQPGHVVSIDCGLVQHGYHADIQRVAYVRRPGESSAPAQIQRMWDVTLAAQRAAVEALQSGSTAVDVDTAGRAVVVAAGFRTYDHATGHALGRRVHDVGPMLGPDWPERYGALVHARIAPDQVYAIEPMAYADVPEQGGELRMALEENVVVGHAGPRVIGRAQRELRLLG